MNISPWLIHHPVFMASVLVAIIGLQGLFIALLFRNSRKNRRLRERISLQAAEINSIFDSSPIGIAYMEGRVFRRANRRLMEMTGYPEAAFADSTPRFLYADDDEYNRINAMIVDQLKASGESLTRVTLRKIDGQRLDVILHVNQVYPSDGGKGSIATFVDDTPLRLKDEELAQSRKMQVVGQLAGGIAHDFNNLLGGIMGAAELIALSIPEDSPDQANIRTILNAASRGSDLTRKLLAFSRKGEFKPLPFDMGDAAKSAAGILERSIDKRISISVEQDKGDCIVEGDLSMVQNALLNLALNSRDAMPDGGRITFRCSSVELRDLPGTTILPLKRPGRCILVELSDSGTGIPKELHSKIFEPFYTTKPLGKGTGLGLAAVYGTMEAHRGGLSVDSRPGHGSTFALAFPLERKYSPAPLSARGGEGLSGTGNILVVDDEPSVRDVVSMLLDSLGYQTVKASGGVEALKLLEADGGSFCLVILDLIMPDMDGRHVYAELRRQSPRLPVIFLSGFTGESDLSQIKELDADGFLRKPCSRQELGAMIKEVLNK